MNFAEALIDCRMARRTLARPSHSLDKFNLEGAYQIAAEVDKSLLDRGWRHAGRKLGFTNSATWDEFDLSTPIWSYVYNRTVIDAADGACQVRVSDLVAPRIEPEIVLGLNQEIVAAASDTAPLADTIDWIAPGFEIVDCHYSQWDFNAADIVADFGAHARLVVGPKVFVARQDRITIAQRLAETQVEISNDSGVVDTGVGSNALGGPVAALKFLLDALVAQPSAIPLGDGELVTTGTLTGIPFVKSSQTWSAKFTGAGLGKLTVQLI